MIRRRIVIWGNVQGVFFRDTVRRAALAAGVAGWVRNNANGTVEAVLEGAPDAVERIERLCRTGPRGAHVDRVAVSSESPEGLVGFTVR